MYRKFVKRALDIFLSALLIITLSPVYLIIAIAVAIGMGWPVLFSQQRIGKGEKPFRLYKFRSMTNAKDAEGNLLPEEERLTRFGKLLRSSSMDELPELWSILIGKMSFIGPRPMPVYYGPYFLPEERKRHHVRGGLIPPESLLRKVSTTYEEQFKCEVEYAENISLGLDIKIFFMTFIIIYKRITNNHGENIRPHLNVCRAQKTHTI